MRQSAELAQELDVRLHTHLAENARDIAYTREKFGCTPAEYAEQLGWVGPDVWHAHCVKLDDEGISLFAATRTGVLCDWVANGLNTVQLTFGTAPTVGQYRVTVAG